MVCPEWYYEKHIKDKEEKEILKEIKRLKKEIELEKRILEHPVKVDEELIFIIDPSPEVKIRCYHLYLEKAMEELERRKNNKR